MFFYKVLRLNLLSIFILIAGFVLIPFSLSCTASPASQQSEEAALENLRQLTKTGKLPPESVVLGIENRFAKTRTGALAKLLRARIRYESGDKIGAAAILSDDIFQTKTTVGDYALWLRGKSLHEAGRISEAQAVYHELAEKFPNSLRTREAKILRAESVLQSQSGKASEIPAFLKSLNEKHNADALLLTAKSYEITGNQEQAIAFYRRTYFYGAGENAAVEAEAKLKDSGQTLDAQTAEELKIRAEKLFESKNYTESAQAYTDLLTKFQNESTDEINLKRIKAYSNARRPADAQLAFNLIPPTSPLKPEGFYELATAFAKTRQWASAKEVIQQMREEFPKSDWTPKTMVAVGEMAGEARNRADESFLLKTALAAYPTAIEVAQAQFELAWLEHESGDFQTSSRMLTEHLARYVDEDNTNRGKAGYWAARDSERAGKIDEACALYDAEIYRYGSNWYGYLALQRLVNMRSRGLCQKPAVFPAGSPIPEAVKNLKVITVAPETAGARELARAENAEELSTVGLFDWAIEELQEAKKTAENSPKINLSLAKHYQFKGENVRALLALAKSYPDYAQMFPEEMGTDEWEIFYPLDYWNDIKFWAKKRNLDPYQVAGFIRQETIFNPNAKSSADAYGLMQLLVPTARAMARKYGEDVGTIYASTLYQPALNIELGTAYIREQYNKFGRVEFVAVAYNAGPGRVPQWQRTLPSEMDEFVEQIPFRETRGYVQGIIRNSAQYRRLYDESGNFKPNVGSKPVRGKIDSMPRGQFAEEFPEIRLDESNNAG